MRRSKQQQQRRQQQQQRDGLCAADQVVRGHAAAGPSSSSAAAAAAGYPSDWAAGMELPRFVQPPKPEKGEGAWALSRLVEDPTARPERVLLLTARCVVAYDLYPKARVHVLILPRCCPLDGPTDLGPEHEPLLMHMEELAQWLAPWLRAQFPGLAPLRCGFHAVPSMKHLHLHLISLDMDSSDLKRPRHWHIFNTDYLVAPSRWAEQLARDGRVTVNHAAEKAKSKAAEMVCPLTGLTFRSVADLKGT